MRKLLIVVALVFGCGEVFAQGLPLSQLPAASAVNGTDLFYDVQTAGIGGVRATANQISSFIEINPVAFGSLTAITTDGSQIAVQNCNTGGSCNAPSIMNGIGFAKTYDGIRSSVIAPVSSSVANIQSVSGYIQNFSTTSTLGGANSFFGIAECLVASSQCESLNGVVTDTKDNVNSFSSKLVGVEIDTTAYNSGSSGTSFSAMLWGANGGNSFNGFQVGLSTNAGNNLKFTNAFVSPDGASSKSLFSGATGTASACVAGCSSQPIVLNRYDGGGVAHADTLQNNTSGFLTYNTNQIATLSVGQTWTATQIMSGAFYAEQNIGGGFPSVNQGLFLGENISSGNNEIDFINTNTGASGDSFRLYQQTGASAVTQVAHITTSGTMGIPGAYQATGTSAPSLANGTVGLYASATLGGLLIGQGSTDDVCVVNKSGLTALCVPTGTQNIVSSGTLTMGGNLAMGGNNITGGGTAAFTGLTMTGNIAMGGNNITGGGTASFSTSVTTAQVVAPSANLQIYTVSGSTVNIGQSGTNVLDINPGASLVFPDADNTFGFGNATHRWTQIYSMNYFAGAGNAQGITQTCTVNQAKTLIFTLGILTGGTCNT